MADQTPGPIGLAVKLPFGTPEEFLARYGGNLTRGGIYLRAKTVKAPGTLVTLEVKLANGEPLITAAAIVHFVTGQAGTGVPGMGVKFLTPDERTVRFLASVAATLPHAESVDPPVPAGVGPAQFARPPSRALPAVRREAPVPAEPASAHAGLPAADEAGPASAPSPHPGLPEADEAPPRRTPSYPGGLPAAEAPAPRTPSYSGGLPAASAPRTPSYSGGLPAASAPAARTPSYSGGLPAAGAPRTPSYSGGLPAAAAPRTPSYSGGLPAAEPSPSLHAGLPSADEEVAPPKLAPPAEPFSAAPAQPAGAPIVASPKAPAPDPSLASPRAKLVAVSGAAVLSAPAFEAPVDEPLRTGPIVGIDLGTTNSCAAFVKGEKPSVLRSREGYNTVPSIIALNARGKLVVGHPAKGQMLTNPRQTVYGAKRLVGRAYDSPVVQQIKDRFAYEIAAAPGGEAAVKLGDRVYSLQQISAMVLREVKEIAQNQIGEPVSRAVITVPAYYNDNQRQAVREAGRLAGLHVERILNEPTAAALAYGFGRKLTQRVLVYDLGGGTFDASVLELNDNVYEVLSTGGDTFLGGLDFDTAIVEYLLAQFKLKTGKDFHGDRVAMQRITDAAERAKCALSERSEMRIHVPFVTLIDNQPYDLDVQLTREKLIELTGKLVDRTMTVCEEVLKTKNLTVEQIDEVILVGGQSRFPLVHEKVTAFFKKAPSKAVHPDEAVAIGAALLAHSLGQLDGVVLIDVLPMAIGIGLPGGRFKPVLERNTPLPASKHYTIGTSRDDQAELEVTIFQGDKDRAQENEYLGTLKLSGLPKGPRGFVKVSITFEVSNECLLKVTAQELSSKREVTSTFSTRDTPEAVKAKMTKAAEAEAPAASPEAPVAAKPETNKPWSGLVAWVKRLFGKA